MVIDAKFLMQTIEQELRAVLVDAYTNEQDCPVKDLFIREDFKTAIDSQALTLITKDNSKFLIIAVKII